MTYEQLIDDAIHSPLEGWDFGVLSGRFVEGTPSWDFREMVRAEMRSASSMLDLGTGGGEFLSSLAPLPPTTMATESYPPNVPIARRRLEPLGVHVADTTANAEHLPFADATFDLVVSRHEAYAPGELRRILKPSGLFITQQVGGRDVEELNVILGAPAHQYRSWDLGAATDELAQAGFDIIDSREELVPGAFHDIGAVVLFLRITPWHIPDFDPATYDGRLHSLHDRLSSGRPLNVSCHRFMLTAGPT